MRSCDSCPNNVECAGWNLHPVLVRVFETYEQGMRDKFDILFTLDEHDEMLLERFSRQVSPDCWSKAALLGIAELVSRKIARHHGRFPEDEMRRTMRTARDAFANFPWRLTDIVDHAPELYREITEAADDSGSDFDVTKRAFVSLCRGVAFER